LGVSNFTWGGGVGLLLLDHVVEEGWEGLFFFPWLGEDERAIFVVCRGVGVAVDSGDRMSIEEGGEETG